VSVLAWIPFLEPVHLGRAWWLLIVPLCLGIAIVYRVVKAPTMERFPLGVLRLTANILGVMALLAALVFIVVYVALPLLPAE
jgi:multisubunit Na+/H+ antiporter MnhF subunit